MSQAYKQADISIIPTVHSEGTSLSCLESQACGNAVLATNVATWDGGGCVQNDPASRNALSVRPQGMGGACVNFSGSGSGFQTLFPIARPCDAACHR